MSSTHVLKANWTIIKLDVNDAIKTVISIGGCEASMVQNLAWHAANNNSTNYYFSGLGLNQLIKAV